MIRFVLTFLLLGFSGAQAQTHQFPFNDTNYTTASKAMYLDRVLEADQLKDGVYLGYYDELKNSLAIKAQVIDGMFYGSYQEWSREGLLMTEINYFKGKRSGLSLERENIEGKVYTNITFWIDGAMDEVFMMEW